MSCIPACCYVQGGGAILMCDGSPRRAEAGAASRPAMFSSMRVSDMDLELGCSFVDPLKKNRQTETTLPPWLYKELLQRGSHHPGRLFFFDTPVNGQLCSGSLLHRSKLMCWNCLLLPTCGTLLLSLLTLHPLKKACTDCPLSENLRLILQGFVVGSPCLMAAPSCLLRTD